MWTLDIHLGKPERNAAWKLAVGKKIGPGEVVEGKMNTNAIYSELNPKCADKRKIKRKSGEGFLCSGE